MEKTTPLEMRKIKMRGAEPFFIDKKSEIGVLLLHGFTSTPYQFKELAGFLSDKGFTVYAPLIAGHGTSPDILANTKVNDWKKSAEKAYNFLKEKVEKIIVIGNSFGGNLAFYLARVNQDNKILGIISLGTPIFLRFQWFIKLRLYTYGWLLKYYHKPRAIYRIDYTDMDDEITYPVIPIKGLKEFFKFIKEETIPHLKEVKVPVLIVHASVDYVVSPKSAVFIHQHIGSEYKIIHWFDSNHHVVFNDRRKNELFERIYQFITEIKKNNQPL